MFSQLRTSFSSWARLSFPPVMRSRQVPNFRPISKKAIRNRKFKDLQAIHPYRGEHWSCHPVPGKHHQKPQPWDFRHQTCRPSSRIDDVITVSILLAISVVPVLFTIILAKFGNLKPSVESEEETLIMGYPGLVLLVEGDPPRKRRTKSKANQRAK